MLGLPDYLLCLVASACLSCVALMGFNTDAALQFNVLLITAVCAGLLAALFATAFKKLSPGVGAGIYVALCLVVVVVGVATSSVAVFTDKEGNHFIFALVLALCTTAVYFLSRTRLRFIFLWAAALLIMGYVEFVYHQGLYAPSIALVISLVMLFVFRSYCLTVRDSGTLGRGSYSAVMSTAMGVTAMAALFALGVFFAVVAPLNPGRVYLKLFTMDQALETVYVNNPIVYVPHTDYDNYSTTPTGEKDTGMYTHYVPESVLQAMGASDYNDEELENTGEAASYNIDDMETADVELISYDWPNYWPLIVLCILLVAFVVAVLIRKWLRNRKKRRWEFLSRKQQISAIYTDLLKSFNKLGMGKAPGKAPAEYATEAADAMTAFAGSVERGGEAWKSLSLAYDAAHYGGIEPTDAQMQASWDFYDAFMRNASRKVGKLKYWFKYFWKL